MSKLRNEINVGRDGTAIQVLSELLTRYHFDAQIWKASAKEVLEMKKPVILVWEASKYVIFEKVEKNKAVIVDPETGRDHLSLEDFEKKFSNALIEAKPGEGFRKEKEQFFSWKMFLPCILQDKKKYAVVAFFSCISYAVTLLTTTLMQSIVDNVMVQSKYWYYARGFALLVVFTSLVMFFNSMAMIRLRMVIDKNLTSKVMKDLLHADYQFFDLRSKGELVFSLNSCSAIRELFAQQVISGMVDMGAVIVITGYIFSRNTTIGIVVLILFFLNVLYTTLTYPSAIELNNDYVREQSKLQSTYIEIVQSIMSIKMVSYEENIYERWKRQFDVFQKKYFASERMTTIIGVLGAAIEMISPVTVLLLGIHYAVRGEISVGMAMALYFLSNSYFGFVKTIFSTYWSFVRSNIYMERLGDISYQNLHQEEEAEKLQHISTGDIELQSVSYHYGGTEQNVLSDISLHIQVGEKIAIVGKSGCGKSTLAKLIVGLYHPTEGRLLYDGADAEKLDMGYIRKQFGIVPQESVLFNKSIYDNIVLEREDITEEDVIEVTKIVNIYEEIEEMPLKFHTLVSDGGLNLSGGQRQRIILARALIQKPKVLVLDEATSALDNVNEAKLSNYLKQQGCTRIIIAHRLSTIIDADKILVMDKGCIVEEGKHKELLEKQGAYSSLYNTQEQ